MARIRTTKKGAIQRLFWCLGTLLLPISSLFVYSNAFANTCPLNRIDETVGVRKVHDGDTLILRDGRKVRLIGIDTPELARAHQPAQPYARRAREQLAKLVRGSNNQIQLQYGTDSHDKYQRLLAHAADLHGNSLNATMLKHGLAVAFTTPPNDRLSTCYHRLDRAADADNRGFWRIAKYRPVNSSNILNVETGFRRIRAHIDRVKHNRKGLWLYAGALGIHIRNKDLKYFQPSKLKSLRNTTITVRGWLRKDRFKPNKKRYLPLRHPSAIETGADTSGKSFFD